MVKRTLVISMLTAVLGFFAGIAVMQPMIHAEAPDSAARIDARITTHDLTLVAEPVAAPVSSGRQIVLDLLRYKFPMIGQIAALLLAQAGPQKHFAPAYVLPGRVHIASYQATAGSEYFYWNAVLGRWEGPYPVQSEQLP